MSWETYVYGEIFFKEDVNDKQKDEILKEFEDVFECKKQYSDRYGMYFFDDANMMSHVKGNKINAVYEKYKKYLKYFTMSLYYLHEADEYIYYDDGREEKDIWE